MRLCSHVYTREPCMAWEPLARGHISRGHSTQTHTRLRPTTTRTHVASHGFDVRVLTPRVRESRGSVQHRKDAGTLHHHKLHARTHLRRSRHIPTLATPLCTCTHAMAYVRGAQGSCESDTVARCDFLSVYDHFQHLLLFFYPGM